MFEFLRKIKTYIKVSGVAPISRRYFVMNAFDGVMTVLGIIIGTYVTGTKEAFRIISAGLGASLAMGISGFVGAYMTEEAERTKQLRSLERSMLRKLGKTVIGRAGKFAMMYTALVYGLSPALTSIISISPIFLVPFGILPISYAIKTSILTSLFILFTVGMFLGKISGKNFIISGLRMLIVGLILVFVLFISKLIL
jgi:predicted membrane protein (TIGR00267 family)